jgi:hypothetical protein
MGNQFRHLFWMSSLMHMRGDKGEYQTPLYTHRSKSMELHTFHQHTHIQI